MIENKNNDLIKNWLQLCDLKVASILRIATALEKEVAHMLSLSDTPEAEKEAQPFMDRLNRGKKELEKATRDLPAF